MASFCLHFQNLIQRKDEFELNEEENYFFIHFIQTIITIG